MEVTDLIFFAIRAIKEIIYRFIEAKTGNKKFKNWITATMHIVASIVIIASFFIV